MRKPQRGLALRELSWVGLGAGGSEPGRAAGTADRDLTCRDRAILEGELSVRRGSGNPGIRSDGLRRLCRGRTRRVRPACPSRTSRRTAGRADRPCRPGDLPHGQGTSSAPDAARANLAHGDQCVDRSVSDDPCGRIGCVTSEPTQTHAVPVDRPIDWWKSAVVYQIYPRSFADSNGDGTGDIPGMYVAVWITWPRWVSMWSGCHRCYASPMDDNGYDISDYQDVDPLFGTLEDLDVLIAGLHERGIKTRDGSGGQPHLRRAPVVHRVARSRLGRSGTGTGGGRPGRGSSPAARVPSRRTGSRRSPARRGSSTSAAAQYYLHLFSPEAAGPQLGEPGGTPARSTT